MFSLLYNLYQYLKSKAERKACLAVLGVDNAGKTTLLNTIQGMEKEVSPTFGFHSTSTTTKALGLESKHFVLQIFDLGGGKNIRRVWKSYLAEVHAVIFVVDSADTSRYAECRSVLHETLEHAHLHDKPILVFANKQDLPSASTAAAMADQLGLADLKRNPFHIVACTAKTAAGEQPDPRVREGFSWVMQSVAEQYPALHPRVEAESLAVRQEEARKKAEREEKVRKMKEERARQAAEDAAKQQAAEAQAAGAQQGPPHQQHHNMLSNPIPGFVESPKISTMPVASGPFSEDAPSPQRTEFSDLAQSQPAASAMLDLQQPSGNQSLTSRQLSSGKPPAHPGAILSKTDARVSSRLSGNGVARTSNGSAHGDDTLKNSFSSKNKVLPVLQ